MPKLISPVIAACLLLATVPARAFHNESEFLRAGELGGGGGQLFTGSRRAGGLDCAVCHVEPEGRMFMTVASHPEGLTTEGRYVPGETYHLVIRMEDEHRGVGMNLNRNTFLLEILDDEDAPAGEYRSPSEPTAEVVEDEVLAGRGARSNVTEWSVEWTAPEEAGALTLYLAGVDGDGAEGGRLAPDGDPWNDDVFAASLRVLPEGAPEEPLSEGGCSVAADAHGGVTMWSLSFLLLIGLARRRRAAPAALALAALLAAGCDGGAEMVVDCTRTICAPDGGASGGDAGPHHVETDAGPVFATDAGELDAGPHHVEEDGGTHDGGPMCAREAPIVETGGEFCMDQCYCRSPAACLPTAGAEACCDDVPVCPTGGERYAGCAPRAPIMVGDSTGCAHGQCLCATDTQCYPMRTAPGCCAGEIRCF